MSALLLLLVVDVFPVAAVESMRKKKKNTTKSPREQKRGSRALAMPAERALRQLRLADRTYEDDKGYLVTEKVWEPDPTTSSDPGKYSSSVFGRRDRDLGTGDDGHRPAHTQAVVHDSGEKSSGVDLVQTHFAVREDCIHQHLGAQFLRDLEDCCRRSVDGGHAPTVVLNAPGRWRYFYFGG